MSRIRVRRSWTGWSATCDDHDADYWTETWDQAYEAAVGHACLHHPHTIDATWEKP